MKKETINVMLFVNEKTKETQPDYKVRAKIGDEFVDAGAGWRKESAKGTKYLSVSLDIEALQKLYKEKNKNLNSDGTPVPNFDLNTKHDLEINADDVFNNF